MRYSNQTLFIFITLAICLCLSACDTKQDQHSNEDEAAQIETGKAKMGSISWPATSTRIASDEAAIEEILARMSIEDKVGQLVMAEIRDADPEDVKRYRLGGILNGGGAFPQNNKHATLKDWVDLADAFYNASIDRDDGEPQIPILWGTDAVHGNNNVHGATIFPHNIGLGATRNPGLIKKIGYATAKETLATGVFWTFAPTVAVPRDDRWGRTYEGYSEDPEVVAAMSRALVEGLQGEVDKNFLAQDRILATAKHFIGDGGTYLGDDQGDTRVSELELRDIHGAGYFSALDAGVQTVMASFNSWNGEKVHGHHYLLTEVLKEQMGFDGLVVSDWNGHGQIKGCSNKKCAAAINAGIDMIMVPQDWKAYYKNTLKQAKNGIIPPERLDDAVRRILRVKQRLGLFNKPAPGEMSNVGNEELIGHKEHRAIARQAVSESLVLLKNNNNTLPLQAQSSILVAGKDAELIYNQLGGWSLTWQGTETVNADFPGATRIVDGIRAVVESAGGSFSYSANGEYEQRPDAAIVIFSEPPYAEGMGDTDHLAFRTDDRSHLKILKKLQADNVPVISLFLSGRPLWVNQEINASDAFVAAWLPGTEGQGVADVLFCAPEQFASCNFKGKLSFSWPKHYEQTPLNAPLADDPQAYDPLFPFGYGLSYTDQQENLTDLTDTDIKADISMFGKSMFKGRGISYYSAYMQEQGQTMVSASQKLSRTQHQGVISEIFDKELQEDAQRIQFDGRAEHKWILQSEKMINWVNEAEQNAGLVFAIRVLQKSDKPFLLSMACGDDCSGTVNLADTLSQDRHADWQDIGVSLRCFEKLGTNLYHIQQPMVLATDGDWKIELTNIRLDIEQSDNFISCPSE